MSKVFVEKCVKISVQNLNHKYIKNIWRTWKVQTRRKLIKKDRRSVREKERDTTRSRKVLNNWDEYAQARSPPSRSSSCARNPPFIFQLQSSACSPLLFAFKNFLRFFSFPFSSFLWRVKNFFFFPLSYEPPQEIVAKNLEMGLLLGWMSRRNRFDDKPIEIFVFWCPRDPLFYLLVFFFHA